MNLKKLGLLGLLATQITVSADFGASISYEKFQRLNTPETQTNFDDWTAFGVNGTSRFGNGGMASGNADFRFYMNNDSTVNFSVPEAYVQWTSRESRLSVGRQLLNWNENENYWLLDTINANQGFYLLGEKKEGLTGVQYDKRVSNNVTMSFFGSYFNVPALNPSVEIKDGEVVSKSEWVRGTPTAVPIDDKGTLIPLYYHLNEPAVSDIVLKKSLGARVAVAWDRDRSEFSSYAIYKPENKLRMNAVAEMNLDDYRIDVTADPVVNHHMVYGMQYKQRFGSVNSVFGFEINDPNANLGEDFDVVNEERRAKNEKLKDVFVVEPNYDREAYFHTSANINRGSYILSLNYIHLMSKNDRGNDDFFSDTVKWKRTVGARIRYYFDDYFNVMTDVRYDLERQDNIFKAEANYTIFKGATFNVGMELIKSPKRNSYWSAYRANDAVYSQLRYAF